MNSVKDYIDSLKIAEQLREQEIIPNTTLGQAFRKARQLQNPACDVGGVLF